MKKCVYFLFLLVYFLTINAQPTSQYLYDYGGKSTNYTLIELDDGYVFFPNIVDPNKYDFSRGLGIAVIDDSYVLQWDKMYHPNYPNPESSDYESIITLDAVKGGDLYYLTGYIEHYDGTNAPYRNGFVACLSDQGSIVWLTRYDNVTCFNSIAAGSEGVMVCGYRTDNRYMTDPPIWQRNAVICYIAFDGGYQWGRKLNYINGPYYYHSSYEKVKYMEEGEDGTKFALTGYTNYVSSELPSSSHKPDVLVTIIDEAANIHFNKYYSLLNEDSGHDPIWGKSIAYYEGKLAILGYWGNYASYIKLIVFEIDPSSESVNWCNDYLLDTNHTDSSEYPSDIIAQGESSYDIIGTMYYDSYNKEDGFLLSIANSNGDAIHSEIWLYGDMTQDSSFKVIVNSDNNYVLVGHSKPVFPSYFSPWIVLETDTTYEECNELELSTEVTERSLDTLTPTLSSFSSNESYPSYVLYSPSCTLYDLCTYKHMEEEDQVETILHVFPNPAENKIHIGSDLSGFTYSIWSNQGAIIQRGKLESDGNINISQLTSGIYFLKLTDTKRQNYTKKFVVR